MLFYISYKHHNIQSITVILTPSQFRGRFKVDMLMIILCAKAFLHWINQDQCTVSHVLPYSYALAVMSDSYFQIIQQKISLLRLIISLLRHNYLVITTFYLVIATFFFINSFYLTLLGFRINTREGSTFFSISHTELLVLAALRASTDNSV